MESLMLSDSETDDDLSLFVDASVSSLEVDEDSTGESSTDDSSDSDAESSNKSDGESEDQAPKVGTLQMDIIMRTCERIEEQGHTMQQLLNMAEELLVSDELRTNCVTELGQTVEQLQEAAEDLKYRTDCIQELGQTIERLQAMIEELKDKTDCVKELGEAAEQLQLRVEELKQRAEADSIGPPPSPLALSHPKRKRSTSRCDRRCKKKRRMSIPERRARWIRTKLRAAASHPYARQLYRLKKAKKALSPPVNDMTTTQEEGAAQRSSATPEPTVPDFETHYEIVISIEPTFPVSRSPEPAEDGDIAASTRPTSPLPRSPEPADEDIELQNERRPTSPVPHFLEAAEDDDDESISMAEDHDDGPFSNVEYQDDDHVSVTDSILELMEDMDTTPMVLDAASTQQQSSDDSDAAELNMVDSHKDTTPESTGQEKMKGSTWLGRFNPMAYLI
ncbi:hypothetical protein QBC34DRAFT_434141 [Podospora aff. communis PSN243]|uniref:Uncharacterized protein n=1 Tax=Podospora aff. communis PSN243 TaxID=3040156 RepID=A0AAV9H1M4_9PEZI|nr:hypothetical protein QBC34DRAFT_434141 [Podospora aff. communis PSN243]